MRQTFGGVRGRAVSADALAALRASARRARRGAQGVPPARIEPDRRRLASARACRGRVRVID